MKKIFSIIFLLVATLSSAQKNAENNKDTIFVVFDYKSEPDLAMSRSYHLDKREVFSIKNKEGDSLAFIGKVHLQMKKSYIKKKKNKTFLISKLITVDVFNFLKPIENKIIFMIDNNGASRKVNMIRIDETVFTPRPQE